MVQRLAIGWDHAGIDLAGSLISTLETIVWDFQNDPSVDPVAPMDPVSYSKRIPFVVQRVYQGYAGILICGTGIGMSMAANRYPGIGAALCTDSHMATMARAHNNANILVLPGRLMSYPVASDCVLAFLKTPFQQGRHVNRIAQFDPVLAHARWKSCYDSSYPSVL